MVFRNSTCEAALHASVRHSMRVRGAMVCLVLFALSMLPVVARAQFATGGQGIYRDNIVWVDWGTAGAQMPASSSVVNVTPVAGQFLRIVCNYQNTNNIAVVAFNPSGRGLSALYNNSGSTNAPGWDIGLANRDSGTTATFTLTCSATFGPTGTAADPAYTIDGLVFADAEQNSGGAEWVSGSRIGTDTVTARVIERYRPPGCTRSTQAGFSASGLVLQGVGAGVGNFCNPPAGSTTEGQGPMALGFLEGVSRAGFVIRGGGRSAISVGVFVNVSDLGDAPAGYGDAQHLPQFTWTGGSLPSGTALVNEPTFSLATRSAAAVPRLGGTVDTELTGIGGATAAGDDANGIDDEDGLSGPLDVRPTSMGYALTLPCSGTNAPARGFIDWNRDGDFGDANETSAATTCSGGGSVALSWMPTAADVVAGPSYLRLRIANTGQAAAIATAAGTAGGGEVEDHPIASVQPSLVTLVKQLDGRVDAADQFTVSIQTPTPTSATTTGSGTNGTSTVSTAATVVDVATPLVLREVRTAGTGAMANYNKTIACVANAGSSGAVPVPSAPVESGDLAEWTITPNLGNDLTCTITNTPIKPTLTLQKVVRNTHGGTATDADFVLSAAGPTPIGGVEGTAAVTNAPVDPGTYTLGETGTGAGAGYVQASLVCGGGADTDASDGLTLALNENVTCTFINDDPQAELTLEKTAVSGAPYAAVGGVVGYAYLVTNTGNVTIDGLVVTDDKIATVSCPVTTLAPGASTTCTGNYTIVQADLDAGFVTNNAIANGTPASGTLVPPTDSATVVSAAAPALTLDKRAVSGAPYDAVGDVVGYEYEVTNVGPVTINALVVTDDKIATVSCPVTTLAPGASTLCTGSYTVVQADMDAGSVTNNAVANGTPTTGTLIPATDTVVVPVLATITYAKAANTAGPVAVGDTITYTLTATVQFAPTTSDVTLLTLTDTLGSGLTFGALVDPGVYTFGSTTPLVATLPAGTSPGTYTLTYTARVNEDATGSVGNSVVGNSGDPDAPPPTCAGACITETPVAPPLVTYEKVAGTSGPVAVADTIAYTLTVTVSRSRTTDVVTLTDTLGAGLNFGAVTDAGVFTCNATSPLVCTLPAGTVPGTYRVTYTAIVDAQATGTVDNAVVGTGPDNPTCVANCTTGTPVAEPAVTYAKSADTAGPVSSGDTITYTLTATVTHSQTTDVVTLTDTLGEGLTFGAITNAGAYSCNAGHPLVCTLPAGTAPGTYTMTYTATVNNRATSSTVDNVVVGTGTETNPPTCAGPCATATPVLLPLVTVGKTSDPGSGAEVQIGDTITYTLTANVSQAATLVDVHLVDTPDAGLTIGTLPDGCTSNGTAITCVLPTGTPVGTYTFVYSATVNDQADSGVDNLVIPVDIVPNGVSPPPPTICTDCETSHNIAASELRLVKTVAVRHVRIGDLVRYTLTVENLGNGRLTDGAIVDTPPAGFTYVEGSLVIDDEDDQGTATGFNPLRFGGLDIAGRQTATLVYLMRVGAGVRPGVQRNQAQVFSPTDEPISNVASAQVELIADPLLDDSLIFGTVFADDDGNGWQDEGERGIPGVRIASVEGLLIETDQHGRYHLVGIPGGAWERGRNFILKVDPSTLPERAEFTTDNPLLRRITPGLPVRFDWGVKLPVQTLARTEQIEMQLGEVFFAPGSAQVRAQFEPVIEKIAAKVREYRGGEVVIDANGGTEALAFERAMAVKDALLAKLDAQSAQGLVISARTNIDDPDALVAGADHAGARLGTVLFDTDKSTIRPEFDALLDAVAAALDRMDGGVVEIVGHTDARATPAYNAALGMRRAQAVFDALAKRLRPEVHEKLRVQHGDASTPVGRPQERAP